MDDVDENDCRGDVAPRWRWNWWGWGFRRGGTEDIVKTLSLKTFPSSKGATLSALTSLFCVTGSLFYCLLFSFVFEDGVEPNKYQQTPICIKNKLMKNKLLHLCFPRFFFYFDLSKYSPLSYFSVVEIRRCSYFSFLYFYSFNNKIHLNCWIFMLKAIKSNI